VTERQEVYKPSAAATEEEKVRSSPLSYRKKRKKKSWRAVSRVDRRGRGKSSGPDVCSFSLRMKKGGAIPTFCSRIERGEEKDKKYGASGLEDAEKGEGTLGRSACCRVHGEVRPSLSGKGEGRERKKSPAWGTSSI